jgi:type II secretory pathway pseudopilin PulG
MQQRDAIPNRSIPARQGQAGYLLIGVLFLVALVSLSLAIAATQIATDIQRDREEEFFDRGMQYERAIKVFYRTFKAYPGSLEALEKTSNQRFLRKRYKDPFSQDGTWRLIHMGEAKLKPMGFFGEPIANTGNAGTNVLGGTVGGGIAGAQPIAGSTGGSSFGNSFSNSGTNGSTNGTSSGTSGTSGTTDPGSSTSSSSSGFGGGAAIIGVSSTSNKTSIKEYRQQKHYNEWEFVYDPIVEQVAAQNGMGNNTNGITGATTPGSIGSSWNGQAPNSTAPGGSTSSTPSTTPPQ